MHISQAAWAVILAGGDGTRLQPLTRLISGDDRPKQFCPIFGGKSLLGHTRTRLAGTVSGERTMFVVTRTHERFYRDELHDVPSSRIVIQPANRGTAAAIAWCVLQILQHDKDNNGDPVVAFFPSDHYYADDQRFQAAIRSALEMASQHPESVILLAAEPTHAEVEYGWIEPGEAAGNGSAESLRKVVRFWEKPSAEVASMLHRGGCLWNTFVMIGHAHTFLHLIESTVPGLLALLSPLAAGEESSGVYANLQPADFSRHVLAECTERLLMLQLAGAGWSDFGKPERVTATLNAAGIAMRPASETARKSVFASVA